MFICAHLAGLRSARCVAVGRRALMHASQLGPTHGAAGALGALAVFLVGCLRGSSQTATAAASGGKGACVCECHFELPGSGLSSEIVLGLLLLVGGGLLRPTVRACLRVLGGVLREAERAFGAAPPRPLHLPNN